MEKKLLRRRMLEEQGGPGKKLYEINLPGYESGVDLLKVDFHNSGTGNRNININI